MHHGRVALWTRVKQRYFVLPGDFVGSMNAQFGCYEQEEIDVAKWVLTQCLSDHQGAMLDVGSHLGNYTIELAKHFSQVVAAEASPILAKVLEANVLWNQLGHKAKVLQRAVSDQSGTVRFHHNLAGNLGGSSIHKEQVKGDSIEVAVEAISLDALGSQFISTPIQFIKIDVEGHELSVLNSGATLIRSAQPILQVEVSPELIQQFQALIAQLLPGAICLVPTNRPEPGESKVGAILNLFRIGGRAYRLEYLEGLTSLKRLKAVIVLPAWAQERLRARTRDVSPQS